MRTLFVDRLTNRLVTEKSAYTLTAKFYDDATEAWAATTPTTARYRIDDGCGLTVKDWTALTPSNSIDISVSSSDNAIVDDSRELESKTLTVQCNSGLSTQWQATFTWQVRNLPNQY